MMLLGPRGYSNSQANWDWMVVLESIAWPLTMWNHICYSVGIYCFYHDRKRHRYYRDSPSKNRCHQPF